MFVLPDEGHINPCRESFEGVQGGLFQKSPQEKIFQKPPNKPHPRGTASKKQPAELSAFESGVEGRTEK